MKTCEVCQVEQHGLVFKTDCDRKNNTTSSPDFIRTRICIHAKTQGCINVSGRVDTKLDYNDCGITTEQWLGAARELIEKHSTSNII